MTFNSLKARDVFVVGDSVMSNPMPKSGFAANSQAKLVVGAIAAELAGARKFPPRLRNTCWSFEQAEDVARGMRHRRDVGESC